MSAFDVYGMTDKLSNSVAEVIVGRPRAKKPLVTNWPGRVLSFTRATRSGPASTGPFQTG